MKQWKVNSVYVVLSREEMEEIVRDYLADKNADYRRYESMAIKVMREGDRKFISVEPSGYRIELSTGSPTTEPSIVNLVNQVTSEQGLQDSEHDD